MRGLKPTERNVVHSRENKINKRLVAEYNRRRPLKKEALRKREIKTINTITENANERIKGYRSRCKVLLAGLPVIATIDSGNSAANVISETFARRLYGLQFDQHIIPNAKDKIVFGTAKMGSKLKVLGQIVEPIEVSFHSGSITFETQPYIIRNLDVEFNIGAQFLERNKIDQLHSKRSLKIGEELIPLFQQHKRQGWAGRLERKYDGGEKHTPVYFSETIQVPPRTVQVIKLHHPTHGLTQNKVTKENLKTEGQFTTARVNNSDEILRNRKEKDAHHFGVTFINNKDTPINIKQGTLYGHILPDKQKEKLTQPIRRTPTECDKEEWVKENFREMDALLNSPKGVIEKVRDCLWEYRDIFSLHQKDQGRTTLVEHHINIQDVPPLRCKGKPLNPVMQTKLEKQMKEWKDTSVIEPSSSPWSFGMIPITLKDGQITWIVDYRRLNEITLKEYHPLPEPQRALDALSQSKIFSTIKGVGSNNLIPITIKDRAKTAFYTPSGLYQFNQIPFGLCNTNVTQARLIQQVLKETSPKMVLPYLDEVCIHTEDVLNHLAVLRQVLQAHRGAGLKIQPKQCSFFQREVEYLGHLVAATGIKPLPADIKLIQDWPLPTNEKEIRTFLTKASYYRRFIPNYAQLTGSLYSILKKENLEPNKKEQLTLSQKQKENIQEIKKYLGQAPLLTHPDYLAEEPLILDTDWSKDPGAIGGVLSQIQNGEEKVICYGARKLTKAEQNYSSNKGELLAVTHFMRQWKHYLQQKPFVLRTDHQALQWMRTMEEPKGMIQRWISTMAENNFTILFRDGKKHGNADALSRTSHGRPPNPQEEEEADSERILMIGSIENPDQLREEDIRAHQEIDPELHQVVQWVRDERRPTKDELKEASTTLRQYAALFDTLKLNAKGVLYREGHEGEYYPYPRLCLPETLHHVAIKIGHEMVGGHMGMNTTQSRLLKRFYFPHLHKIVEGYIRHCIICQRKINKGRDQRHTLRSIQEGRPFQKISIDFVGPLKASRKNNTYLLTVKDCFTRWMEAFPTQDITAHNVARLLEKHIFSRHGVPDQIHSDQGAQFTSEAFREICELLGIIKTHTPAYNPKSNVVERSHRDMNSILRALVLEAGQDWEDLLPTCLLAIRTARHRYTGVTPFYAMYGREAKLPLDLIFENPYENRGKTSVHAQTLDKQIQNIHQRMRQVVKTSVERARGNYNGKLEGSALKENDLVWLFTPRVNPEVGKKLSIYWSGPWRIQQQISDVTFEIQTEGRWNKRMLQIVASIDRLKRYHFDPDNSPLQLDLRREDVVIQDEFIEQGIRQQILQEEDNEDHLPLLATIQSKETVSKLVLSDGFSSDSDLIILEEEGKHGSSTGKTAKIPTLETVGLTTRTTLDVTGKINRLVEHAQEVEKCETPMDEITLELPKLGSRKAEITTLVEELWRTRLKKDRQVAQEPAKRNSKRQSSPNDCTGNFSAI